MVGSIADKRLRPGADCVGGSGQLGFVGSALSGEVRNGADANSEHAESYMLLYPVCQGKNIVPDIFMSRLAQPPARGRL
jgi:hypothetical protein